MIEEKKIPECVDIARTKRILDQMMNCICKIKLGTGFFCKIKDDKHNFKMNALITNYHVIDEKYYNENSQIHLMLNDEKVKVISLNKKRKTYFDENYDIAIIEILESDGIKNYLELEDKLFEEDREKYYDEKSVYIIQYPGEKVIVSYGLAKIFIILYITVIQKMAHQVHLY